MTPKLRKFPSPATLWVTAVAVAIGVCWTLTYCIIVPIGDDLGYANAFHRSVADADAPYRILHYLRRHYEATNGRFANSLTYLSLGALPQWASAVMCGMMVPAYYLLTLYFCGVYPSRGKGLAATASAAFVAVCFCWYDYFTILCVNFNYVWGMALPMAVLWLMKRNVPLPRNAVAATIVFLLCIAAGAMGNMIDRAVYGSVVDLLDFYWQGWHWPALNVAALPTCLGAFFLIVDELRGVRSR